MVIATQGEFVIVDGSTCNSHEVSDSYQDFGLLCARSRVRWALLRTGDIDAPAHYALRDVLRTVVRIAGIPASFKLAVVASCDSVAEVCRSMQQELRELGCDARVFRTERQAEDWLRATATGDPEASTAPR